MTAKYRVNRDVLKGTVIFPDGAVKLTKAFPLSDKEILKAALDGMLVRKEILKYTIDIHRVTA